MAGSEFRFWLSGLAISFAINRPLIAVWPDMSQRPEMFCHYPIMHVSKAKCTERSSNYLLTKRVHIYQSIYLLSVVRVKVCASVCVREGECHDVRAYVLILSFVQNHME